MHTEGSKGHDKGIKISTTVPYKANYKQEYEQSFILQFFHAKASTTYPEDLWKTLVTEFFQMHQNDGD